MGAFLSFPSKRGVYPYNAESGYGVATKFFLRYDEKGSYTLM